MKKTKHIHKHKHNFNWHVIGIRFDHIVHDPRFWAVLALGILLILMIVTMIVSKPTGTTNTPPIYPYVP